MQALLGLSSENFLLLVTLILSKKPSNIGKKWKIEKSAFCVTCKHNEKIYFLVERYLISSSKADLKIEPN